ncbi:type II restriction endonuclease [Lactococcus cremoris]|nr:type II restriction endonuclease [Lactococcus cremoris]
MKYIELLEIAFDGSRNRDFEMVTADLFKNVYGFNSILLVEEKTRWSYIHR